ncbi:branched-chain amino acid ABC transporter permease [Mycolicibacterium chitae]|uniref:Branched-chain amino acid ABC transporter permease protein n=2 Tax=Mycolicibacterium TaxID=1866885 RepID=A0A448I506_MYCCI|nr:branched-chain amino acid ABC transporter permease [Mycolicibacterium chitae]MCV7106289.1 branched-chain amino acid ABC transporter permease [Mycolicibacterium chitae]BBZ03796.1 branched-chain amino acid ABC transporter permease [Mycolicibacterium chitae]VEG47450.1 branched-chain amino acid ABC transporter permease protein [Mycolicibacterium chitae]
MSSLVVFLVGVLTLAGIYAALAMVLNLVAGWAGMWDLGVAGLVGVASYTYILLTQTRTTTGLLISPGLPIPVGVVAAMVVTALVALLIAVPSIRLRGEFFLITTLAFAEVIHQIAVSETALTRGTTGFSSIDRPFSDLVPPGSYRWVLLAMTAVVVLVVFLLMNRLAKTPYVRLLRAARDNEPVARSLGKRVVYYRIITYVFAGALIGLIAPLYLWHVRSVVPSLFVSEMTFVVWTALVIGGIGSRSGPVLGASLLIVSTELLTFLQGSAEYAQMLAATRPIILGLLLILVLRFRPSGLVSERSSFQLSAKDLGQGRLLRRRGEAVSR